MFSSPLHTSFTLGDTVNRNMDSTQQISFTPQDHVHMTHARRQAQKSLRFAEVPVGAIIVTADGAIVGAGYNRVEKKQSQLEHAEIQALRKAAKAIGGWRLDQCTLYVTLEPCMMCLGAALLSRVKKIIYGAPSNLFGISMLQEKLPPVYQAHTIILQGLQEAECSDMLKHFFLKIRSKKEASREQNQ
ncbi:MAG: tRNA(adenine34) deaminase [Candidatus Dependentiae bacterium]|nr:tRNA(adenine34) deaminase [Candidatus Dependentiae bacterium]